MYFSHKQRIVYLYGYHFLEGNYYRHTRWFPIRTCWVYYITSCIFFRLCEYGVFCIAGFALIGIWYSSSRSTLDFNNADKKTHPIAEFTSIAILNAFNPALIFTFTALFTMIGMLHSVGHPREIVTFLFGIAVGSMAFWYGIYRWINHFKQKNQDAHIQTAYTYSGRMLGIVGIILIVLGIIHLVF